jgi:hypothetical protein
MLVMIAIRESILQSSCSHDQGINETRACHAICKYCGKDLGFIGTEENKIRRQQK